ncbi:CvpA family protein [Brevundimonas sp.]|uniref:CvpA family protein n=1 Tax=Brevundimonas sp. TaxID=1871086 RepID=UPI0025FCA067|nr:CvpA family protein [Brevundimonas sp.]
MTGYDLFAVIVILFSAMAGWVRGGAREIISLFSFVLAALIALVALPVTGPLGRGIFDPDWVGTVLAAVLTFFFVYFGVRLLGAWASRSMREHQQLGPVDRGVGVAFGLARALVMLGVIHLIFYAAQTPDRIPGWYREAAVHPIATGSARAIQAVLPGIGRAADSVTPTVTDSVRRGASDSSQSSDTEAASQPG